MTIQLKTVRFLQISVKCVKVRSRNLDGRLTLLTRQVSVHRPREVVHRGGLAEVRVNHDVEVLEFFENPVDRRRTYLRS